MNRNLRSAPRLHTPRLHTHRLHTTVARAMVCGLLACMHTSFIWAQAAPRVGERLGEGSGRHAESILQASIARLESAESFSAQIRQRINVHGESLVGSGSYQQATFGSDRLFRLDLKIPLGADQVSTLIQVADGRFLWTYRSVPDASSAMPSPEESGDGMPMRTEMTRVDLNEVRQSGRVPANIAFGGIPHMLRQIGRHYQLDSAVRTQLQQVPVWRLQGPRIKTVEGEQDAEQGRGVSPWVQLLIGLDDHVPYHIEFRDEPPGEQSSNESIIVSARRRQAIAMDLFEVQIGAPIDPSGFVFRPRDHRVDDVTQAYLDGSSD